jgi:hypothetical protein
LGEGANGLLCALRKDSAGQESSARRDGRDKERCKFNLQCRDKVCNNQRRRGTDRKCAERNLASRGKSVLRKVSLRRFHGEWVHVNAAAARCSKLQRGSKENATPRSNIKDPNFVLRERAEESLVRPSLNPRKGEARGWMQSSAERLARINRHHRVARGNRLLTPRWSDHNAPDPRHWKFRAPGGLPLFCRNCTNL